MAIDIPPIPDLAAILEPQQTDRNKRGNSRRAAIVLGTILILSDGSECVVAGFDAQGRPLCHPPQN
ncbi:hypothetical protein H7F16_09365 [Gemmobacter straminiformis]|uniref:Uncharacterized protein n=2 Tax=Paragemmobacter straminiformis TaxID=2045119 RepID=A0A842I781_9RHOB|nr:hypothetical protein [Gemmobacter straminiformis]